MCNLYWTWTRHWSLQATLIIDNVHLHILPSMNPDGYSLRTRGNANKIDLNRDFPDQVSLLVLFCCIIYSSSKLYILIVYICLNFVSCPEVAPLFVRPLKFVDFVLHNYLVFFIIPIFFFFFWIRSITRYKVCWLSSTWLASILHIFFWLSSIKRYINTHVNICLLRGSNFVPLNAKDKDIH